MFLKAWMIVGRRLNEVDPGAAKRHNRYRLIQDKLATGYLIKMADVLACTRQGFDPTLAMSLDHSGKPIDVINEAMYTGHVHWNHKRAADAAMGQAKNDVSSGMFEMDGYDSLIQLSHWKFVYAEFLEHQLGLVDKIPRPCKGLIGIGSPSCHRLDAVGKQKAPPVLHCWGTWTRTKNN